MPFAIRLLRDTITDAESGVSARPGWIVLGDYREQFVAPIGFWDAQKYERQWRAGIQHLISTRRPACLITSIFHPDQSDLIRWWLLYPSGKHNVAVRESFLIISALERPFDESDPYALLPSYERVNEEGRAISEWILPLTDFSEFAANRSH